MPRPYRTHLTSPGQAVPAHPTRGRLARLGTRRLSSYGRGTLRRFDQDDSLDHRSPLVMLAGQADMHLAARMLAGLGPGEVVLTHRDGLLVHANGQSHEAGFFPAELIGRSGRGDTCLAAYVSRRLSSSPAEATVWAAAVTSLKMEAEGPFRRDIREVEDLVRRRYSQ